jgi:hypothetical protein
VRDHGGQLPDRVHLVVAVGAFAAFWFVDDFIALLCNGLVWCSGWLYYQRTRRPPTEKRDEDREVDA